MYSDDGNWKSKYVSKHKGRLSDYVKGIKSGVMLSNIER